jgi:hypothetical protein
MTEGVTGLGCPIRQQLVANFTRLYSHYTVTLTELLHNMTLAEASNETRIVFDTCVSARKQLSTHEIEHGCADR